MDIIDIPASDWASSDMRTIVVSPVHVDAPFKFRVRKFNPAEGDVVHEMWKTPQGMKQVALPRYALAEMHEAGETLKTYIETSVSKFIVATVGHLDTIFWETYGMAFRHINEANVCHILAYFYLPPKLTSTKNRQNKNAASCPMSSASGSSAA